MSREIYNLRLPDGETVGAGAWRDVESVEMFEQNGPMGHYPWYRVTYKNGMQEEYNSLYIDRVQYKIEETE